MTSEHENRMLQVIKVVEKEPGIKFREIMRRLEIPNGSLAWLTRKLEKQGQLKVKRTPRNTVYYPNNISEDELKIAEALRKNTTRLIIRSLLLDEPKEFTEIVKEIVKSSATTSFYVTKLAEDNIVSSRTRNKKKEFSLQQRMAIDKLIEEYHPTFWTKSSENFADIMNSL